MIKTAEFVISNTDISKCPNPDKPEYAFIGRSNVGKSSLINAMTGKKKLAKISGKPGKTQLINHFIINDEWYLVDLPGYGYAKASKTSIRKWNKFIEQYILERKNLLTVFVLLDSRLEPQKIDIEFMEWLGEHGLPFVMVFTKIDKMSSTVLNKNLIKYQKIMLNHWQELPPIFTTSAETKFGTDKIVNYIEETNPIYHQSQENL